MKTRVQKWGNSLAVRIPRPFAREARLREDIIVDVSVRNGRIIVTAAEPDFSLEDLVKQITARNRHTAIETGAPVGNEIW